MHELIESVRDLQQKHNTFPGEIYLRVGAAALDAADLGSGNALDEEGLLGRFLPEARFRGRQNHRIRYALIAPAAWRGGLAVDLLEEVTYWPIESYWEYQLMASVALLRCCAARQSESVEDFAEQVLGPFLT